MMSKRGRQDIEKQIANPLTLEQRIRKDISRAQKTRDSLARVMALKTTGDKEREKNGKSRSL